MPNGSISKQGDVLGRRTSGTTVDLVGAIVPENIGGTQTNVTDVAASVGVDTPCFMIYLQADKANGSEMYWGHVTSQYQTLEPGQGIYIPISNVNKIYVKMGTGLTGKANYIIFA